MRPRAVPTAWTGWPVPRDHEVQGRLLSTVASEAVDWIWKVRSEGGECRSLRVPSEPEGPVELPLAQLLLTSLGSATVWR